MITLSLKNLRISLTFGFFFVLSITSLQDNRLGAFSLIFCIAHEFGHLMMMKLLGSKVTEIKFYGAGISINSDGISSLTKPSQAMIYLAGPMVNLLLAAMLGGELCALNLSLAAFNLLPISYFDGGRLVSLVFPEKGNAAKLLSVLSYVLIAALMCYSVLFRNNTLSASSMMTFAFIALSWFLDN